MSFKKNVKKKLLDNSDSYNKLKEENSILKNRLKELDDIENKIDELNRKQSIIEETLDSNYHLFNLLMLDYDLKPKGILKNMQDLCQELLNFVVIVCEKNDLDYWLVGGNLIGVVRHEGFIPWDDDMDVGLIRKEYYKFNSFVVDEVKNNNLEQYIRTDIYPITRKNFIHPYTQINCMSPDNLRLANIDIFPYDYANDKNFSLDDFCNYRNVFFKKLLENDEIGLINEYYDKFNLDWNDGKYIIPNPSVLRYAEHIKKDLIFWEKEKIMPFASLKFNGKYYNCPNDSNYFLEMEFGDYKNIPRILKDQHYNVNKLRGIDNINELYEEYISKLKEYTEKFL
jgi:phosphorylcholine metabolism protein LicD